MAAMSHLRGGEAVHCTPWRTAFQQVFGKTNQEYYLSFEALRQGVLNNLHIVYGYFKISLANLN